MSDRFEISEDTLARLSSVLSNSASRLEDSSANARGIASRSVASGGGSAAAEARQQLIEAALSLTATAHTVALLGNVAQMRAELVRLLGTGGSFSKIAAEIERRGKQLSEVLHLMEYAETLRDTGAKVAILSAVRDQLKKNSKVVNIRLPEFLRKRYGINFKNYIKKWSGLKPGTVRLGRDTLSSAMKGKWTDVSKLGAATALLDLGLDLYRYRHDGTQMASATAVNMGEVVVDAAATHLGGIGGAWVGAAIGTAICPGLGTAVGGVVGRVVGGYVASAVVNKALDKVEDKAIEFVDQKIMQPVADKVSSVAKSATKWVGSLW